MNYRKKSSGKFISRRRWITIIISFITSTASATATTSATSSGHLSTLWVCCLFFSIQLLLLVHIVLYTTDRGTLCRIYGRHGVGSHSLLMYRIDAVSFSFFFLAFSFTKGDKKKNAELYQMRHLTMTIMRFYFLKLI